MKSFVTPRGEFWNVFSKLFGLEEIIGIRSVKVILEVDAAVMLEIEKYAMIDESFLIDENGEVKIEEKKYYLMEKPDDSENVVNGKVEENI